MCYSEPRSQRLFLIVKPQFREEHKAYVLDIPMEHLEVFKKADPKEYYLYIPHDHEYGEPWRYRKLSNTSCLGSYSVNLLTKPAIIDRTLYGFDDNGVLIYLNLDNPEKWENGPPPTSGCRYAPKLISLRNKLYIFGGFVIPPDEYELPFGEIYDPHTKEWSVLRAPDASPVLSATDYSYFFVASLGESEGKIMVYRPSERDNIVYIYDTNIDIWQTQSSSAMDTVIGFHKDMCKSEFINEDDNNLYWVEKETASIIAFDWKKNHIYSGPIIGLERPDTFLGRAFTNSVTSLHHLSANLFCLIWFTHDLSAKTVGLHVTVLRVIKHTSIRSLDAMVVGCFHDTIDGSCIITDALPV